MLRLGSGSLRAAFAGGRHWLQASPAVVRLTAAPLACHTRGCSGAAAAKPLIERLPQLYNLASELPMYGVGAKVYRSSWADKGYTPSDYHWMITKVVLTDKGVDGQLKRGKAWGVLRWKGVLEEKARRIRTPLKKEWCHLFESYATLARRNPHFKLPQQEAAAGGKVL